MSDDRRNWWGPVLVEEGGCGAESGGVGVGVGVGDDVDDGLDGMVEMKKE